MVLCLKVSAKNAEKAKQLILAADAFSKDFKPTHSGEWVFFPVMRKTGFPFKHSFVEKKLAPTRKRESFEKALARNLSEKELSLAKKSFDLIGDIAVIEIPGKLSRKKKQVAQALLKSSKQVKVVCLRKPFKGKYRLRKLQVIGGDNRLVTVHRENGCSFKLDVSKAFFSPRLALERDRVAAQAREGENVLVLFAGVGPYAIQVAKKQPFASVVGIELNPIAVRYFLENVLLNHVENRVEVVAGDAARECRNYSDWADRIVMPLPFKAKDFLRQALVAAKKGCIIHFYCLCAEGREKSVWKKIESACSKSKRKCRLLFSRKVIGYAPRVNELAFDFLVL